jgi:diguanylate cyclase (GGDEF)-like protein
MSAAMQKPAFPVNEKTRVETLRALKLLDTSPEDRFDRLTRLAKRMFGVPISLVSLVDENRQWFKSKQGLDADETPRDISFCGHAILGDDIFMVTDASKDERFHDNPLVIDNPNIRFYAGCPLRVNNGSKIGTLCIIDQEPRKFSDEDLELLRDLADMAEQEIAAVQLASVDELTLISNRRGFIALAQHALNICRRKDLPTSLVFLDLNKFKQINDTYGHAEGDKALVAFSEMIKQTFRDSDVFARLGGDEFVVLLTDSSSDAVTAILERFDEDLKTYNEQARRGYDISYSAGVAAYDSAKHKSIEDMLAEADTLMYEQKKQTATPG